MTVPELGSLERVPIQEVWQHEANDLTPWLAEHPDLIAEALELEYLELKGREVSVGGFSADLVFRDGDSIVVVENMFGSTNHDHIGKLITYAAGLDASHAVLLSEDFRPEHRSALSWLNRVSTEDCSFFGLVLEAWRIGNSPPAPRLRVEVQPDDWSRAVKASGAGRLSERDALFLQFWTEVMEDLHQVDHVWQRRKTPRPRHWMTFRNDSEHCVAYNGAFGHGMRLRAEAYIDTGDVSPDERTSDLYRQLYSRRGDVEAAFGVALDWQPLEKSRGSRVAAHFPEPLSTDEASDDELRQEAKKWLVDSLVRLRGAMYPVLEEIWDMDEWD